MQPTFENRAKTKLIASVVVIVVLAGIVIITDYVKSRGNTDVTSLTNQAADDSTIDTSAPTDTSSGSTAGTTSSGSYKDGTYSATENYYVPNGTEQIKVSVTLKSGIVTDSSIVNSEGDHDSAEFQEEFADSYKSLVVGKSISGLKIAVISGASDTTQGFNQALNQIAAQAQA